MNTSTITNIQKNGLDLVFKYIKKTNPFVVSYRISKDNKDSYSNNNINGKGKFILTDGAVIESNSENGMLHGT